MAAPAPSQASRTGVRPLSSVTKTLAILDLLGHSDGAMRLVDVAQAMRGSRATVYQKLITLVEAGWVEQAADGTYRLSLHAARMGEAALRQASLGERSKTLLEALVKETGETASLAVLTGTEAELVQRVEAEVVVRVRREVGFRLPLDQSASGRVLTAFASDERRRELKAHGAALASDSLLREVRRKGHAISSGRDIAGVQSVAVPVFDASGTCVSALSVVAPLSRFHASRYVKPLLRTAQALTAMLEGRSGPVRQSAKGAAA
jgi:IclR family KDG regulon transcriptional repressor